MDRENSFVFYRSFKESIDNSPSDDRLALYEAIANYALNGTPPDLSGGTIKMIWPLIEPQLNANRDKRQNGRKGGAPRKTTGYTLAKTTGSHSSKPNENENVNANVNGDSKVINSFDQIPQ